MNRYDFYHKGKRLTICFTNDVAEMMIAGCADLAAKGMTPDYWHNPDTGEDVLMYVDRFTLYKEYPSASGNRFCFEVTPDRLNDVCKAIRGQLLSSFVYKDGEWIAKCVLPQESEVM